MRVSGNTVLNAPRERVWEALNDPAVLVRTIPGCHRLEAVGDDAYRMTVFAGVASIKGTYEGEVRLTEQVHPDSFLLRAAGAGAPGTVNADVRVTLAADGELTQLAYDADAVVGGVIGGVGQRVLSGVARKTAGEFFQAVDDVLTGRAAAAAPPAGTTEAAGVVPGAPALGEEPGAAAVGRVYEAPAPAPRAARPGGDFGLGVIVGAAIALAGAVVGGWVAGRRR
jgi:uncharacterized protein